MSPFRLRFQAYLWQYGSPGKGVVIDFRMGGEREGPKQVPGQLNGMLQTDGHAEYDLVCGLKKVHACSLANARRKHVEAIKANAKDQGPIGIVTLMDDLLAIDALTYWPLSKGATQKSGRQGRQLHFGAVVEAQALAPIS